MVIKPLVFGDELWEPAAEYAHNCSWRVGKMLAAKMRSNAFGDWGVCGAGWRYFRGVLHVC